ncbi:MAG: UDP-N-acetylmuramate dehydrogenase [Parcubacteria group bacterium]|jgi:UDP-N-acetylmuramate dehydrogenase
MSVEVKQNISLAQYTTIKIGGPAKFFIEAEREDEIIEAVKYAKEKSLPVFILGGGSNILVSDQGYDGLIIKILNTKCRIPASPAGRLDAKVECGAGCPLAKVVSESVKYGLTGLEWAAGIPGTIGGAVAGNAGAFGASMAEIVERVEVLDTEKINADEDAKVESYESGECRFGYRDSVFKQNPNLIILSCALRLKKGDGKKSQQMVADIMQQRKALQPYDLPSSGSFFKNADTNREKLLADFKEDTGKEAKGGVIPAGYLIDRLGLRGKKIGGVMISERHGNFIVNIGNAKAEDVIILASLIKQKVRNHFGIQLKEEVRMVGF